MKKKYLLLFVLCILLMPGCSLVAGESAPYIIDGKMVVESSSKYEAAGFEFYFINKSNKQIKNFTMVFYIYDEEGNPPGLGKNNIVINVASSIKAGESLSGCVSLDSYISEIPEEPYTVDYLYVSKITYEDNSVWDDPFGFAVY